ncbi:unnamed protein product [Closterium sp. Yama58-4]|nr:unnamed protein product [Closterium sp. Yama58-4]
MRQAMLPEAAGGAAKAGAAGAIGAGQAGASGAAKAGATGEYKAGVPGGFDTAVAGAVDSEGVALKDMEFSQPKRPLKPPSRLGSDAAPFVFVPFRGLAARAKSIASDDRLGVVFTGHKDGRVLVWRVLLTGMGVTGTKRGTESGIGGDSGGGIRRDVGVKAGPGKKGVKRGLGIGLQDPAVQVALVADWQAHTATVTALIVTPYGELWSAGDRGIIKAWNGLSLSKEIHRAFVALEEGLEEEGYRPIVASDQKQQQQNVDVAGAALPNRISPACVELRQHRGSSGSAAGEQARNDVAESNLRGYGGGGSSTSNENRTGYDPATANAAAAATGGAGCGAGAGAGAANNGGTSPRALSPVPESIPAVPLPNVSTARGAVRVMVADAATGWVWTAGPASACIWDARKKELIRALSSLSEPSASEEPSRSFPPRGDSTANSSDVSIISSSSAFSNTAGGGGNSRDRRMEGAWKLLAKSREVLGKAKGAVTDAVRAAAAAGKGEEYLSGSGGGIDDLDTSSSGGSSTTFSSPSPAVRVSGGSLRKLQAATAVGDGSVWFGFRSGALVRIDRCGARLHENGEVSAWPSALPSPPLQSALLADLAAQSQAFTKRRKLQVATGTWNVGEEKPDGETVQALLGEVARGADVVAVGLQEVEMGARAIALAAAKESVGMGLQEKESGAAQEWTAVIRKALGAAGGSAGSSAGAAAGGSAGASAVGSGLTASSDPSSISSASSASSSAAAACADDGFVRIASRQLAGMLLTVWVRESLLPDISDVETGAVACGFGRALGNKGGVGVRMTICGRVCAIINCHLAAHDNATAKRNEDWHRIYTSMEFGRSMGTVGTAATNAAKAAGAGFQSAVQGFVKAAGRGVGAGGAAGFVPISSTQGTDVAGSDWVPSAAGNNSISGIGRVDSYSEPSSPRPDLSQSDLLIWMGDLNYRLDGVTYDEACSAVARRQYPLLLDCDQLRAEMKAGRAFVGMQEAGVDFAPTYKFDRGTFNPQAYDSGEKRRVPAWCDRILFRDSFTSSSSTPQSGETSRIDSRSATLHVLHGGLSERPQASHLDHASHHRLP